MGPSRVLVKIVTFYQSNNQLVNYFLNIPKCENIIRYERAYYSNNPEVRMEFAGIDIMFSDVEIRSMPDTNYYEYMKDCKNEAKIRRR